MAFAVLLSAAGQLVGCRAKTRTVDRRIRGGGMKQRAHGFVRRDVEQRPSGPHRAGSAVMCNYQAAKPPSAGRDDSHQVSKLVLMHPAGDDAQRGGKIFVLAAARGIQNVIARR